MLVLALWGVLVLGWVGRDRPIREAALFATTIAFVVALAITQTLSAFAAITLPWVAAAWVLASVAAGWLLRRSLRPGWVRVVRRGTWSWSWPDALAAAVLASFALGTLLAALLYPATNYDSLTYHLPRVIFWYQNHSVAPFPTPEGREIFSGPLAEYLVLQLKVLALGSDRLANLVQWFSYVAVIAGTSLVAGELGAGRRGQQAAALATAAAPMAALQASTTQNDLTTALWIVVLAYCAVRLATLEPKTSRAELWLVAAWAGTALGLGVLTKASAYLAGAPFVVWIALSTLRRWGWSAGGRALLLVAAAALAVNAAWYAQNASLLGGGDVIGARAPGMAHVLAAKHDPSSVVTLALENGALELGTPFARANSVVAGAISAVVRSYGGRVNDPGIHEPDAGPFVLDPGVTSDDIAPAPLLVALLAASVIALAAIGRGSRSPATLPLALASCAAFGLTAGLVSWNHFTNRILLGSLLVAVPLVGVAWSGLSRRDWRAGAIAFAALLALSVAWGATVTVFNVSNRLVSLSVVPMREGVKDVGYWNQSYADLAFQHVPDARKPFTLIADVVQRDRIRRLGIDQHGGDFPILPLLELMPNTTFGYQDHVVLAGRLGNTFDAQATLEILPESEYPGELSTSAQKGSALVTAQHVYGWVLYLYEPAARAAATVR